MGFITNLLNTNHTSFAKMCIRDRVYNTAVWNNDTDMEMYEQSFYLAAVNHGREFELIFKHRDTFRVHSVFTHAINLVAGSEFLRCV